MYKRQLLRLSVVADPIRRGNTDDNTPAVIHLRLVKGDQLKITVAPKGFGSENMSVLKMFKPAATVEEIEDFIVSAVDRAGSNPCPPICLLYTSSSSFRLIALFSLPAGVGLSVLARPILQLLYPAVPDTAAAAAYHLQILGAAVVFVCLMILTNAILQACGRVYVPIVTALILSLIHI